MKTIFTFLALLLFIPTSSEQDIIKLTPGIGFEEIKIGDSYDAVQETLGFGKKKSYNLYIADELFDRSPDSALECLIGFDHYIKYEYLLTLPVHYIFFKDNKVVQIKSTSFPEYYHTICENVEIGQGIRFWENVSEMKSAIGEESLKVEEDYLILDTYHYFSKGITLSAREKQVRTVHVYQPLDGSKAGEFTSKLKSN